MPLMFRLFPSRLGFDRCGLDTSTVHFSLGGEEINTAVAKQVPKNLLICWCIRLVIHQQVSKRFFSLFVIGVHKVDSILIKHAFSNNSNLFPITRTSEELLALILLALHRPHIDPTSTLHRPYIDPTSTLHRPYIDPTSQPHVAVKI